MNTSFTDLNAFLKHLVAKTNTNCLTPLSSLDGSSSFLVSGRCTCDDVHARTRLSPPKAEGQQPTSTHARNLFLHPCSVVSLHAATFARSSRTPSVVWVGWVSRSFHVVTSKSLFTAIVCACACACAYRFFCVAASSVFSVEAVFHVGQFLLFQYVSICCIVCTTYQRTIIT